MSEQLQRLLERMDVVRVREQLIPSGQSFNIFTILRPSSDEVNLHSRFLYELLNPNGTHGMGTIFLRLFATTCGLPPLSYDTTHVKREHANIDLLIQDNQRSIIIENKIYASDQHEQLKRYYEYVKTLYREPFICYLTLNGNEPSDWSVGTMKENVHLLSYAEHINNWLSACIKEAATQPALRETIIQYQSLIRHLSNTTMDNTEKQAVIDLLSQGDNTERAAVIARNWRHVQWHAEYDFWNELLAIAKESYQVLDKDLFSDDWISKMVHGGRSRYADYGLVLLIGQLYEKPVEFKIGRGWDSLYYGVFHSSDDTATRNKATAAIQNLGTETDEYWTGYRYNQLDLDLNDFDYSPIAQKLASKLKRQEVVRTLWDEVQEFILAVTSAYTTEFGNDFQLDNSAT